jgi:hypothetical protein
MTIIGIAAAAELNDAINGDGSATVAHQLNVLAAIFARAVLSMGGSYGNQK